MQKLNKRGSAKGLTAAMLKMSPIAAGCAVLLATGTSSVYAQEAQTPAATPSNTVVVTGIRRGIEDALSAKRNNDMIVETISAEDLGRLPNDSIADALASLPGVAAQVIGGRAATLNIRGLSGDFVNTTFNGREQASVGDNRAVFFDQYPSELISAATVYKTPDAELIGQGLSATVDLKSLLPLDFAGRAVQFKILGQNENYNNLNSQVNSQGARISASYIDQFADRTIGVALGYAHLNSPVEDKQQHTWWVAGPGAVGAQSNVYSLGGGEWWANSTHSVRDGYMGVVEWKPNKNFTSTVDAYYSKSTSDQYKTGFQSSGDYSNVSGVTASNGFATSGNNLAFSSPVLRSDYQGEQDHIFSIGWKNTYKVDKWTLKSDISGSTASARQNILEMYYGSTSPVVTNFTSSPFGGLGISPTSTTVDLTNPANLRLGDAGGWGQDGYDKFPETTDKVRQLRFDIERELDEGPFRSVAFGVNRTNRDKTRVAPEYFVNFANAAINSQVVIPTSAYANPVNLPNGLSVLGLNAETLLNSGLYKFVDNINGDIYAKDWGVSEKISTGYGQLNIDTTLLGMPIRGNVGVQYVHSVQSSTAYATSGGSNLSPKNISGGASYNNVLPSLNLIGSLDNDQEVRLGIARELQRPRFDQMNASNEASLDLTKLLWTSTAGNPALKPTLADAYDISYTKYFGKKGYISLAPYYKSLKTYIYQEGVSYDFTGYTVPTGVTPASNIGTATTYVNGTGGKINGLELTVSLPLDLIHPALQGFGIDANGSHGNSKIQTNNSGQTSSSALPGFSSNVANMILYYTNGGFEIRYRESYRSAYLGEIQGFGANLAYSSYLGVHNSSLQASYEVKDGSLKGLTTIFQVLNLNDPAYIQTGTYGSNNSRYASQIDHYGRGFTLGVNYKF